MKTLILTLMLTLTTVTGVVAAAQPVFAGGADSGIPPTSRQGR